MFFIQHLGTHTRLHWVPLNYIELMHWATIRYTEMHWFTLSYIKIHWAALNYIELHWDTLSYIELTLWATLSYSREAISWLSGAVTGSTHRIPHPFNCISWMHFSTVFLYYISPLYFWYVFLTVFLKYISIIYFSYVFLKCISQMYFSNVIL